MKTLSAGYAWDEIYTIEWYDERKEFWEVVKTFSKAEGLNAVIQAFHTMCINNDGQYRLTTPK